MAHSGNSFNYFPKQKKCSLKVRGRQN